MNRKCSRCCKTKEISDFYAYQGKPRGECKKCSIKRNVKHQRRVKAWYGRDYEESRRAYMRAYYENNKEKFARYRQTFRERHPDYYRDYADRRKN